MNEAMRQEIVQRHQELVFQGLRFNHGNNP